MFLVALDWVTRTAFARRRTWYPVVFHKILISHRTAGHERQDTGRKGKGAKVGLKINATKTKLMSISTKRGDGVKIEGEQVEDVDKFIYLGSNVSYKGGANEEN